MTIRSLLVKTAGVLLALTTLAPVVPAAAQQYPTKPIRLIIPFPPGGSNDVKELIALAKQQPGTLGWAGSGVGSFQHLGGSLFQLQAGVKFLFVPFKGGGPATLDVIAGHNKVLFAGLFGSIPHIRSGRLRPLGVGSLKRSAALPDLPTISEAGVPDYEAVNWFGIAAPAGTPADVIARLHKEITAVQDLPSVQKHFESDGAQVVRMSSAAFGDFMVKEYEKWGRVLKESGIKAQ